MKLIKAIGMKRPVCASCFEYPENCIGCEWHKCAVCGEELSDSEAYEYRGAFACEKHHEESIEKRDFERQEVMEEVEHSTHSQVAGEWHNGGYKTMKTDAGGNPVTKIKEPLRLKKYEGR
jgi:hypothetical protein